MKPLISIIIPAYNHERYIAEALNSCLSQSYENIEVIVIDDGSTDKTWNIIHEFSLRDKRIKAFRQENCGVGLTLNCGMNAASGSWLTFCGSDDSLPVDAISSLTDKCEGFDLVIGEYETVNDTGEKEYKKIGCAKDLPSLVFRSGATWAKLYRKSFLVENNVSYPPLCIEEDTVFLSRLIMHHPKTSIVRKSAYFYWNHNLGEKSLTRRISAELYADRVTGKSEALRNMLAGGYLVAHERYYFMYAEQLLLQLQTMFDSEDRERIFAIFRDFILSNYSDTDDKRLEILAGMSREDFENADYASFLAVKISQDRRESVADMYALGQSGLRYIIIYFRLWFKYKVKKRGRTSGN